MKRAERLHLDVLLLGAEWATRAFLRAQLIDRGYEVAAVDEWPIAARYLRSPEQPRIAIVDLRGLPSPEVVLDQLGSHMPPGRVLVVAAIGTVSPEAMRRRGFQVVERPATVGAIVAAAEQLMARAESSG